MARFVDNKIKLPFQGAKIWLQYPNPRRCRRAEVNWAFSPKKP